METLTVIIENKIGILEKLTTVFTRNRINIDRLTLEEAEDLALSHITICIACNSDKAQKLVKQLRKIIEVAEVTVETHHTD